MAAIDKLAAVVAWAATAPARRWFTPRRDLRGFELRSEDGLVLRGSIADVPDAVGTVAIGHGYRDDRRQLEVLVPALAALGLRTVLFDFRAHGKSEGKRITIGYEEARDVRAILAWAETLGGPVSYVGFSMGAAAYLLSGREAHAAVLDSPYDTLEQAISVRADRFRVPTALKEAYRRAKAARCEVVIEEVRPIDAVPRLVRPTLVVFGRSDTWLPRSVLDRYRAACSPSCRYLEVDGGHDDHMDVGWVVEVARFLEANARA